MDENVRKLVFSQPIPERLIESLAIAPLIKPHDIGMWVRCGGRITNHVGKKAYLRPPTRTLNSRQKNGLQMLVDGYTVGQAAQHLGVQRQSFTNTITEARWRLGAETVEQAISIATARGIIKSPVSRESLVAKLNSEERLVLAMYWEGASLEEMALMIGVTLNTIKMRLRGARRKMEQTRTIDAAAIAFG